MSETHVPKSKIELINTSNKHAIIKISWFGLSRPGITNDNKKKNHKK